MSASPPAAQASHTRTIALAGLALFLAATLAAGVSSAAHDESAPNATVSVYDGTDAVLSDATAIETAIENGTLDSVDELVAGQRLVVAIESPKLADVLAAHNGTTTERFLNVFDGNASLRLVQTNPTPERPRKVVRLGPRNATVYRTGNTTYALLDTGEFDYRWGGVDENRTAELWGGERFAVVFGYGLDEHTVAGPEIEFFKRPAEMTLPELLAPEVVNGTVTVNVPPEESLSVRVTLDNRTHTVPVDSGDGDGKPRFTLDFRDVPPPTPYTIELVHDGIVADRQNGTVTGAWASIRNVSLGVVDGRTVVNASVALSHGGQVQILNAGGEEVGEAWVTPSPSTSVQNRPRVSIDLHGGVTDTLRLRAVRYPNDDPTVYAGPNATVTLDLSDRELGIETPQTETPTATPSPTATPTATSTPTPTTTPSTPPTTPSQNGTVSATETEQTENQTATPGTDGSGFGLLLTVGGVVGALLVSRRL